MLGKSKALWHPGSSICLLPGRGSRGQSEYPILHSSWSIRVQQIAFWSPQCPSHLPEANAAGVPGRTFPWSPGLCGQSTSPLAGGGGTHWPVGESCVDKTSWKQFASGQSKQQPEMWGHSWVSVVTTGGTSKGLHWLPNLGLDDFSIPFMLETDESNKAWELLNKDGCMPW